MIYTKIVKVFGTLHIFVLDSLNSKSWIEESLKDMEAIKWNLNTYLMSPKLALWSAKHEFAI